MNKPSDTVRLMPYPVLEVGNLSYTRGEYRVEVPGAVEGSTSVRLNHSVFQAAFLESALRDGKARFGCLVSVPLTGFRELQLSNTNSQVVKWDQGIVGEPPLIRPLIVAVEEFKHEFDKDDGVADAWQGVEIVIPKGARLALHDYMRTHSSISNLIELYRNSDIPLGSFRVQECSENGYYFHVDVSKDLFRFIQDSNGRVEHRRSILTHMVSRCLELLVLQYGTRTSDEDGSSWRKYRNLLALATELEQRDLGCWDDDGFDAAFVASCLYPHRVPEEGRQR